MLAAPSLTTSVSWVMVLAEDWAAWANLSCPEAAPDTSILVSSTRALAVFRMFSLIPEKRVKVKKTNKLLVPQNMTSIQLSFEEM